MAQPNVVLLGMPVSVDPLTALATFIMVVVLSLVGYSQIRALRLQVLGQLQATRGTVDAILRQTGAALLTRFADRYDSNEIRQARVVVEALVRKAVRQCSHLTKSELAHQMPGCFVEPLKELRQQGQSDYRSLHVLANFYEDLGFYCEKRYLDVKDVIDLYRYPILTAYEVLRSEVSFLQAREDISTYKYFLWLYNRAAEQGKQGFIDYCWNLLSEQARP